jgi:pantoate--beta-alanine ligase
VIIANTVEELRVACLNATENGLSVGFVPTMGALHEGHMALVNRAKKECDLVIVSVFVNPTQFNNPDDLKLYPRTPEKDTDLLRENGCDVAFFPGRDDVYPKDLVIQTVDLGEMEKVMEGAFRPGHFKGVVQVVWRLFDLVKPTKAYFGLKDFQQVAVIKYMVKKLQLPVEIVPCPTLREPSGLAMSSRNMRLSERQKEDAVVIFRTLTFMKENASNYSPAELTALGSKTIEESSLKLEYLQIVDSVSLKPLGNVWSESATACIAAYCGEVRLIDNMTLF